jgi:hypothetical protein
MKSRWLVLSLLLSACGPSGNGAAPQGATQTKPAQPAAPAKPIGPGIKGLSVGMDIQDAPSAMMTILAEQKLPGFGFTEVMRAADGTQCALMYTKDFLRGIEDRMKGRYGESKAAQKVDEELLTSCLNSDGVLSIKAASNNQVNLIEVNDVKDIFDVKGMPPAEFAKKLSAEYHVLEMKPNELQNVWSSVSPDGVRIEVDAKEVMGIPMVRLYMSRAAP